MIEVKQMEICRRWTEGDEEDGRWEGVKMEVEEDESCTAGRKEPKAQRWPERLA